MIDIIAAILLTAFFALGVGALIVAAPLTPPVRLRFALVAIIWLAAISALAAFGVFAARGSGTIAIGTAILVPIVVSLVAAARSSTLRRVVLEMPMPVLVAIHAGRLLGIFFLLLLSAGRLTPTFATAAGWGDIAVALAALPVAWAIARRARGWYALAFLWSVIGFIDLVTAVTLGVGSAPGSPVRFIFESPETATIASLPWVLIPAALVPLYLLTHIAVFAQLVFGQVPQHRDAPRGELAWNNHSR
jgi:hypothetical protein